MGLGLIGHDVDVFELFTFSAGIESDGQLAFFTRAPDPLWHLGDRASARPFEVNNGRVVPPAFRKDSRRVRSSFSVKRPKSAVVSSNTSRPGPVSPAAGAGLTSAGLSVSVSLVALASGASGLGAAGVWLAS